MTDEETRRAFAALTVEDRVPAELRERIGELVEVAKQLDLQVEAFARDVAEVSDEYVALGDAVKMPNTDWDAELAEVSTLNELDVRAHAMIERLSRAVFSRGAVETAGYYRSVYDEYGVGGFGLPDYRPPDGLDGEG